MIVATAGPANGLPRPSLRVHEVSFSYDRAPGRAPARERVLDGVSMTVAPGEILALIGPNGAGKTTLLKIAAGLLQPQAGRAEGWGAAVAYLSQVDPLPGDWTVQELVELGRLPHTGLFRGLSSRDHAAVRAALDRTGLRALAGRTVDTLSGGEQQRVALARALAQEPSVLLLDEPTNHLDPRHQVELFATLRAAARDGVGVVAVVHDLVFAARADRCLLLADGAILAEGPPAVVLRAETLSAAYGTAMEVLRVGGDRIIALPALGADPAGRDGIPSPPLPRGRGELGGEVCVPGENE